MVRMSKELAYRIAKKLVEDKEAAVEVLKKELSDYVTAAYLTKTPKEIIETFKKHPEWFVTTESIRLEGHGFNYDYIDSSQKVIVNNESYALLPMNKEIANKAKTLQNKYEKERKSVKELRKELETALFNLRSFSAIQKHLPEAVPFLPTSNSLEVSVNFDSLRKKLAH